MKRLRIAIQSKGRLHSASIQFLNSLGLQFERNGRSLITPCQNATIDIFFLRSKDIPEYVAAGVADFGITGENVLREKDVSARIVKKLGFAQCRLVIAVPEGSTITTLQDLEGERIATSYPFLLSKFLEKNGVNAAIVPISGSVEVAPELNLADAICDITQTGNTLRAHDLQEFVTILQSQAVLIESPFTNPLKSKFFSKL